MTFSSNIQIQAYGNQMIRKTRKYDRIWWNPRPLPGHPRPFYLRKTQALYQGNCWYTWEWQVWPHQVQADIFYQGLEDDISIFVFKASVQIATDRYAAQLRSEYKNLIFSYLSIAQAVIYSHCENLWLENSGAGLGHHPRENYREAENYDSKQAIIDQQNLRCKFLSLWIRDTLTIDTKRKLRSFSTSYPFNSQDDVAAMLFVIVKMVIPDTRTGCSDINNKLETIDLRGIDHYINSINHATELTGTENKEVPTPLNMSHWNYVRYPWLFVAQLPWLVLTGDL